MVYRHAGAQRPSRNLRVVPPDGEEDGSVAEDAEIVPGVSVFPDIFAVERKESAKCLLEASVELIAKSGSQRGRDARHNRGDDRGVAPRAGQHQVLIKRRLQSSRIREAKNRVRLL